MATGAGEMIFRCIFNGSLSMSDINVERRPYHKNCTCALHNLKGKCSHAGSQPTNVPFTERKFGKNNSFAVTSIISSQFSHVESTLSSRKTCINEVQVTCNVADYDVES